MTYAVRVDASDPTPPYEQLRRQLADAIGGGVLAAGTRLPTVRQLASDLGLAPGTVMRAYSELEASGHVATARGSGTTVKAQPTAPRAEAAQALDALASGFVLRARATAASDQAILDAVAAALGRPRGSA